MYKPSDLIDDRYKVVEAIGIGGMGVVLRVLNLRAREEVALKYCNAVDQEQVRRFAREIRFMAAIEHEHVMPVLTENLSFSPPYFTMPLADHSIETEATAGLSAEEALEVFKQICLGVQAIHNVNGTHRDIKPGNALRMPDGKVRLSDLGLMKLEPRDSTTLTQTSAFVGTRVYCAPEQLLPGGSRDADARTDIYLLGKTLYQLLTGEFPALMDTAKLPNGLGYIVEKATRERPEQRYQSVGNLMDAIEGVLLAQGPGVAPELAFAAAIQEAQVLVDQGRYVQSNLERILTVYCEFTGDSNLLIRQFEQIPNRVLLVIAANEVGPVERVLYLYRDALYEAIDRFDFSYAEVVAKKLNSVFSKSRTPTIKAISVQGTLIASVKRNRWAAMDVFDAMLTSVSDANEALSIADALREYMHLYKQVAERVPKSQLHSILRAVQEEALAS
jgi:serine/threonine protein kinase